MIVNNSRKILVPLATMLVAGAVAVGSGATFTSQSTHTVAVASGVLSHDNNEDGATLSITNIQPGDVKTGFLIITNDGTLDSTLTIQETADATQFVPGDLKLKISQVGRETPLYNGNFGELDNTLKLDLGSLNVGDSTTLNYEVSMPLTAGNANQGKTASVNYQYVTTQK